jgi:uncharacterized protein YdeI (YjbR/CyaY-like superfamily)
MAELIFKTRGEFREWLTENAKTGEGVWLVFGKKGGPKTLTANEALEEALCFGWIDGLMKSVDDTTYVKYFKQRSETSNWSDKNKSLVEKLEQKGMMTDLGRAKIEAARKNGSWDAEKPEPLNEEQFRQFEDMLKPYETAYANFLKMPRTARTAYTSSYFFTKTEDGRQKRFNTVVERLNLNLNPMESMKKKQDTE